MAGFIHPQRAQNFNPAFTGKEVMPLNVAQFDFGSGMPLPPSKSTVNDGYAVTYKEEPFDDTRTHGVFNGAANGHSPFRSFARNADIELLDYLRARRTSPFFLNEIDKFLAGHPEIARQRPHFVEEINHTRPLDAYRFFIKGYTKPSRYIDGALPDPSNIPLVDDAMPLAHKVDAELTDFFAGYEYRIDILTKIDHEVKGIADALYHNQRVTMADRKLVTLTWFGNPIDVFKYYEYNYQTDWLPHRYLPEHVVLSELPKQVGYTEPVPRQITYGDDDCLENMRSHSGTRARMARACDVGVDVIEVLLTDFTSLLARQGLRRDEIERMKRDAIINIDHQRQTGGGRDIVDMVMDRAKRTHPSNFGRRAPKKTSMRMQRIHSLQRSLHRLLRQEAMMYEDEPLFVRVHVRKMREHVEREVVLEVTQMALDARVMQPNAAKQWRNMYSKQAQAKREERGQRIDLLNELSLYL